MNSSQLGKKLKEARLAKKMTQSDVVGTFITRNMLSQIESGAAFPSLRTLEYLANALEIPIHYLIPDNSENPENALEIDGFKPISVISNASNIPEASINLFMKCKTAFLRGDYDYVISQTENLNDEASFYYDESAALLARAYLNSAKNFQKLNSPKQAISCARSAADFAGLGLYASREIRTQALLLLDEISEKTVSP